MKQRKTRTPSGIAINLQVDGEIWHRVSSLDHSGPDDRHFVTSTDENGVMTVRFGDGQHGARLPSGADQVVATYGTARRFVAVVEQQGRVIVDKDWGENVAPIGRLYGVYRGIVTSNVDPISRSRLLVQIAAVLNGVPSWAMPCRPVGATAVPAIGASVWIAFEEGDSLRPVWMGTVQ
jgi:Type VI secretion system/phage-baseplate injector OB domain